MRKQFFWDGNKRTSTIVANKIMIEGGAEIIRISDKSEIKEFIYNNCIDGISF